MATVINMNGASYEIQDPTLESLQGVVGGYIEVLRLKNGKYLVVNEEGLMRNLPINPHASILYGSPIVGNVVICSKTEL
jgi:uncharacterized protein YlzI (FlbEa/FlbD family)